MLLKMQTTHLWKFALQTSILLRKRMIDVRRNHRELITPLKSTSDSAIRFCGTKQAVSESGTKRQKGELTVFDSSKST